MQSDSYYLNTPTVRFIADCQSDETSVQTNINRILFRNVVLDGATVNLTSLYTDIWIGDDFYGKVRTTTTNHKGAVQPAGQDDVGNQPSNPGSLTGITTPADSTSLGLATGYDL